MNGRTHLLFGLLFGILFIKFFSNILNSPIEKMLFCLFLLFGIFFPDIDLDSFIFKHRGFLHSIFLPVIIFGLAFVFPIAASVFFGFSIGYFSHLASDMLTINGIYPFYPIKYNISGPVRTGSYFENIILGLIVFAILFLL